MGLEVWLTTGLFFVLEFGGVYMLYHLLVKSLRKPAGTWAERHHNASLFGFMLLLFTVWGYAAFIVARALLGVLR